MGYIAFDGTSLYSCVQFVLMYSEKVCSKVYGVYIYCNLQSNA